MRTSHTFRYGQNGFKKRAECFELSNLNLKFHLVRQSRAQKHRPSRNVPSSINQVALDLQTLLIPFFLQVCKCLQALAKLRDIPPEAVAVYLSDCHRASLSPPTNKHSCLAEQLIRLTRTVSFPHNMHACAYISNRLHIYATGCSLTCETMLSLRPSL